ncbi:MAG: Spy/CpxP family protein refolding chaperone [Desulfobacterales bacterium]
MKLKAASVVAAIMIAMASESLAGPGGWGGGGGMGRGPGMGPGYGGLSSELPDLTPEQIQKMEELRKKHWAEVAPLQNERLAKRSELRALWAEPNPDQEKILAKQRELAELDLRLREKMTRHRFELHSLLTPEQRERLPRMGRGMGPGRGGRMLGGRPW